MTDVQLSDTVEQFNESVTRLADKHAHEQFIEKLHHCLNHSDLGVSTLASKANISPSIIKKALRGRGMFTADQRSKILTVLENHRTDKPRAIRARERKARSIMKLNRVVSITPSNEDPLG